MTPSVFACGSACMCLHDWLIADFHDVTRKATLDPKQPSTGFAANCKYKPESSQTLNKKTPVSALSLRLVHPLPLGLYVHIGAPS